MSITILINMFMPIMARNPRYTCNRPVVHLFMVRPILSRVLQDRVSHLLEMEPFLCSPHLLAPVYIPGHPQMRDRR